MRNFLSTYNLHVEQTSHVSPSTQCVGDEFIMDAFRTRGACSVAELQHLNACRLFLQVARLSDITSEDGSRLTTVALSGTGESANFGSLDRWPRQGRPPSTWWVLWRRKLKHVFSADGSAVKLRQTLGAWYRNVRPAEWNTLVSQSQSRTEVYVRNKDGQYNVWSQSRLRSRSGCLTVRPSSRVQVACPPSTATPASLGKTLQDGTRRVYSRPFLSVARAFPSQPTSFREFVSQQPSHIQRLLQFCDMSDANVASIVETAYLNGSIDGATDGGLLNLDGTYGFVIGDPQHNVILVDGKGHVDGNASCMSSTRTELAGMFAFVTYLRLALEWFQAVPPRMGFKCTAYCDSQAALRRMDDVSYDVFGTTWRCRENYDLEAAIRGCLEQSSWAFDWHWVRGHASKRKQRHQFTRAETLNDAADVLASLARSSPADGVDGLWPEQVVSLVSSHGRMGGRLSHDIRYCCTAPDMLSYWQDRYEWTKIQVEKVDIMSTKAAVSRLRGAAARRIQKLRCGWLPVNSRESRIDPDRLDGCSSCSTVNLIPETVDHVFQCNAIGRKKALRDRLATLHYDFRKWKTSELLIQALTLGATAWAEGNEIPSVLSLHLPDTVLGRLIARAYVDQTSLGWHVLFRGFWANSWRHAQEHQFSISRGRERQDTGDRWARQVQSWFIKLFELLWGLRNEHEHGAEPETQRLIRLAKCERAIRRLYHKGEELPYCERTPFRDPIEVLLQCSVPDQELWISKTEGYLPRALKRVRRRARDNQRAITAYFDLLPNGF